MLYIEGDKLIKKINNTNYIIAEYERGPNIYIIYDYYKNPIFSDCYAESSIQAALKFKRRFNIIKKDCFIEYSIV